MANELIASLSSETSTNARNWAGGELRAGERTEAVGAWCLPPLPCASLPPDCARVRSYRTSRQSRQAHGFPEFCGRFWPIAEPEKGVMGTLAVYIAGWSGVWARDPDF